MAEKTQTPQDGLRELMGMSIRLFNEAMKQTQNNISVSLSLTQVTLTAMLKATQPDTQTDQQPTINELMGAVWKQ